MAASVASVAIYVGAQSILANPSADTSGLADHAALQSVGPSGQPGASGPGQGRGNQQPGRAAGNTRGGDPTASGSPSVPTTTLPTSSDSATDAQSPTTTDPTGGSTNPTGGSTDPTSDPTTNPTGPTDPGAGAVQFTSTPPIDPAFGTTYSLRASGGSGKGIVFSIDPATTHRACSLDNAGTTVTFDHAGTCVISAHATTRSAARALAGRGVAWLPESLVEVELASRALVPVGVPSWRVPIEVRLYRQNAAMAPTAEALWQVIGGPVDATDGPGR